MPTKPIPVEAGERHGILTLVREVDPNLYACHDGQRRIRMVHCRCDCGGERTVELRNFQRGRSRSCGCLRSKASRPAGIPTVWPKPDCDRQSFRRAVSGSSVNTVTIHSRLRYGWTLDRAASEPARKRTVQRHP